MRIKKMFQGTVPENKILDTTSSSQTDTYSCRKINELVANAGGGGGTGGSGVSIDQIYPVGSIYISASATVDPNVVFTDTTWERFANGKTLIGVDENDADFETVGLEGGSKDAIVVKHSHSVTGEAASDGAHTHTVKGTSAKTSGSIDGLCETWNDKTQDRNGSTSSNGAHTHTVTGTAGEVGEDGTGKNLQPFITVFMWKRVA